MGEREKSPVVVALINGDNRMKQIRKRISTTLKLALAGLLLFTQNVPSASADGIEDSSQTLEASAMPGSSAEGITSGEGSGALAEKRAALLEQAKREDVAIAIGHYARSRSLLISAIREFDRGYRLARPDSLINSDAWRDTLIQRAEDLEKVLSPQPRMTVGGASYEPDPRLLGAGQINGK